MPNLFEQIRGQVGRIPRGKVSTYGELAKLLGIKNVRLIGFALHQNTDINKCPCHRVVKRDGSLAEGYAFGGIEKQKEILIAEGVVFLSDRKVNLELCGNKF